ncbi:hypothetical protein [Sulfitobacter sp. R18_1]|uniref:hypothetical protein n=1 Tax=Sulfitobacter sp. R18_1 TaxID=2821104 RepID=UPI001ADC8F8F|nr:hypothetical protein [Sulfitobacter sp. R18_1]MBO9428678.1 hypothetical protein [Sulfitobacter sp. R18_1]
MENALIEEQELEAEKQRFRLHIRGFEVLFRSLGREKLDRLMLKVWKQNAKELAAKMDAIDRDTLGPRMAFSLAAAKGVLTVIGNDDAMSAETLKGLLSAIYKLGQTRFDESFPHKDDKYGEADMEALRLLHHIEMVNFSDYSEKEILDILESGSEGDEAQEIAKSIRAAQATIKETPDTASKRFDELAAVGEYDIHGFIEAGRLKS